MQKKKMEKGPSFLAEKRELGMTIIVINQPQGKAVMQWRTEADCDSDRLELIWI